MKLFQLTAPQGGRLKICRSGGRTTAFQLTAPQGGRLNIFTGFLHVDNFNSRPRKGADYTLLRMDVIQAISTHGPARGPTMTGTKRSRTLWIFQLTAPQGGRRITHLLPCPPCLFQLTAPQGGRRQSRPFSAAICLFQLTAPQGGRQQF